MTPSLLWHSFELRGFGFCAMSIGVVLRLYNDSPPCGKDIAVCVEIVRLEVESAKDWKDG